MAVAAPMPMARVRMTEALNPGARRRERHECLSGVRRLIEESRLGVTTRSTRLGTSRFHDQLAGARSTRADWRRASRSSTRSTPLTLGEAGCFAHVGRIKAETRDQSGSFRQAARV